jgi:hypothetical protein
MKTIELTAAPPSLTEVLRLAEGSNLILRTPEGREFVLAEIDDFAREVELVRQNDDLMRLLDARSGEKGKYTLDQVRELLDSD